MSVLVIKGEKNVRRRENNFGQNRVFLCVFAELGRTEHRVLYYLLPASNSKHKTIVKSRCYDFKNFKHIGNLWFGSYAEYTALSHTRSDCSFYANRHCCFVFKSCSKVGLTGIS